MGSGWDLTDSRRVTRSRLIGRVTGLTAVSVARRPVRLWSDIWDGQARAKARASLSVAVHSQCYVGWGGAQPSRAEYLRFRRVRFSARTSASIASRGSLAALTGRVSEIGRAREQSGPVERGLFPIWKALQNHRKKFSLIYFTGAGDVR